MKKKYTISIEYCPKCGWLLRSAYIAQELLTTFSHELVGVLLKPSEKSGHFSIHLNELEIYNRIENKGFPEIKQLKQLVRDYINPGKNLGHSDKKKKDK